MSYRSRLLKPDRMKELSLDPRRDHATWDQFPRGLTLVEVLAVLVILVILIAILVPAVSAARESGRRTQCGNSLRQVASALQHYSSANEIFPPGVRLANVTPTATNTTWCRSGTSVGYAPWTIAILPFIEKGDELYSQFTVDFSDDGRFMLDDYTIPSPNGDATNMVELSVLHCPSSHLTSPLRNNYFGVQGAGATAACESEPNRMFFMNGILFANSDIGEAHIRDGTSHVLLIGETRACSLRGDPPGAPEMFTWFLSGKSGPGAFPGQVAGVQLPINADSLGVDQPLLTFGTRVFGSNHVGGCFFATADASVRFFKESTDIQMLRQLAVRNDGGLIPDSW